MSIVRFIGDHHFGHESCAKRRGFKDSFEMAEYIIKKHNSVVHKKDVTYLMGDITMHTDKWYFYLDQMNGIKKVILGNHDEAKHIPELLKYVKSVASMVRYKGVFLTHCPIHPQELEYRVSKNIHAHLHEYSVVKETISNTRDTHKGTKDDRYIGVSCEQIDYIPKTLEELGIKR